MSNRGSVELNRTARLRPAISGGRDATRRKAAPAGGDNVFARAPLGRRSLAMPAVKFLKHGPKRG